ncbi:unnamed protein product [Meganyctiphanes norvegica]|uniref:Transient receptor potential cation channel subfamily M member 3 n=1 Tax=Meganyctiphanes norvegica TaxID=48144 RepID=A0AAV2QII2_MEGNR
MVGSSWIESVFNKRECCKFIPSSRDNARCCCGQLWQYHADGSPATLRTGEGEDMHWSPQRHTQLMPTDAYGTLEFQGRAHPTKAQYIRLSHDTRPENILALMSGEWGLDLPKLLITVIGGKTNFDLQPKLKKVICKGLLNTAKTTGAWVFTGGTNTGVTSHVGEAFVESSLRTGNGRVVSVGIAPWGVIERRQDLIGSGKDVPYALINNPKSKLAAPNSHHTYFLFVDNGTAGKYGAELILRRKLENYLSQQRIEARAGLATPVVCVVIEGGPQTIRQVLELVTDNPPIPVVVCDGTGRAADIIAFLHKYAGLNMIEANQDTIIVSIMNIFELKEPQAKKLFSELLQCMRKKELIYVYRLKEGLEFDQTILSALLHSKQLNPLEQLSLVLTWNRVDIARSHVFNEEVEWQEEGLEQVMMDALVNDRIEFVKLLLEQGITMNKFLSIQRLEELYNSKQGHSNTLRYIVSDVCRNVTKDYRYTLIDIGLVINQLMGGAYISRYSQKKFKNIYACNINTTTYMQNNNSHSIHLNKGLSKKASVNSDCLSKYEFEYPFSELMVWAVLTKRQQMAMLMWQHGEEALAKALVAAKLYKSLAMEAADDDLETEIYDELRMYGKEFERLALDVLSYCYIQNDYKTHQLLTYELKNWSKQTCLSLAVAVNHKALLAHPCCQILLADLWLGGLRTRRNTNTKVLLGLIFPPVILFWGFKNIEEVHHMPQIRGEYHRQDQDSYSDSETDSSSDGEPLDVQTDYYPETQILPNSNHNHLSVPVGDNRECSSNSNIPTSDNNESSIFYRTRGNLDSTLFSETQKRQLPIRIKIYEFYNAPICKFWFHSIAYIFFLCLFTYVVLVKLPKEPQWMEWYVAAYIFTLFLEKIREILSTEPVNFLQKLEVWSKKLWNPFDLFFVLLFLLALVLRLMSDETFVVGRVIYCVDIIYWYVRLLEILSANKYLGPLITMIGKMVQNMVYFVVLLVICLMAFGVCRQSILYPNEEPHWILARHIFYQPYFMLYGEVFAPDIDPECGGTNHDGTDQIPCHPGRWITPIVMSIFLLVGNILLLSLLIAVFNSIFNETNAISHQIWMSQRFRLVMEFEEKPVFPPPIIFLSHIHRTVKFFWKICSGKPTVYDHGLKLFLDEENLERIHDFEEDCMEGYYREKNEKDQMRTEERIRVIAERTEGIMQRVEDMHIKFVGALSSISNLDFHVKRLETPVEQTLKSYDMVHQFMETYMGNRSKSGSSTGSISSKDDDTSSLKSMSQSSLDKLYDYKTPHSYKDHKDDEVFEVRKLSKVDEKHKEVELKLRANHSSIEFENHKQLHSRKSSLRNERKNSVSREKHTKVSFAKCNEADEDADTESEHDFDCKGKLYKGETKRAPAYYGRSLSLPGNPNSPKSNMTRPRIQVIPPSSPINFAFTKEYTSLAHVLETVCMSNQNNLPPSPEGSPSRRGSQDTARRRYASESGSVSKSSAQQNPLRIAEESDYCLMEGLIRRRMHRDSENLAVSLEDLCLVLSEVSDVESRINSPSTSRSPTLIRRLGVINSESRLSNSSIDSSTLEHIATSRAPKELIPETGSPSSYCEEESLPYIDNDAVSDLELNIPPSTSTPRQACQTDSSTIEIKNRNTFETNSSTDKGIKPQETHNSPLELSSSSQDSESIPEDITSETRC